MNTNMDTVVRTDNVGKGAARKLRAAGRLPAVVYAQGGEATPIHIDPIALDTIFRKSRNRNTIIHLDVNGTDTPCLIREAQRHPLTREILHVDFYKLAEGQQITVDVPVVAEGRPVGAALGGRLRIIRRTVPVSANWDAIPAAITVDVSAMNIGDFIRISEISTPEGASISYESDFNVINVYGKRGAKAEDGEDGEEEVAAAS